MPNGRRVAFYAFRQRVHPRRRFFDRRSQWTAEMSNARAHASTTGYVLRRKSMYSARVPLKRSGTPTEIDRLRSSVLSRAPKIVFEISGNGTVLSINSLRGLSPWRYRSLRRDPTGRVTYGRVISKTPSVRMLREIKRFTTAKTTSNRSGKQRPKIERIQYDRPFRTKRSDWTPVTFRFPIHDVFEQLIGHTPVSDETRFAHRTGRSVT